MRLTTDSFIERARKAYPDANYDYSAVVYQSYNRRVIVSCPLHGPFSCLPQTHLRGRGACPVCANLNRGEKKALTHAEFIRRARLAHPERDYDYSHVHFRRAMDKVEIICPLHGAFHQRANNHLQKIGCNTCAQEFKHGLFIKGIQTFIEQARAVHKEKYTYEKAQYRGAFQLLEITCPKHGSFWQSPDGHLNMQAGCNSCTSRHSKRQKLVEEYLASLGVDFRVNTRREISPFELDIVIPEHKVAIEFNGGYWHAVDAGASSVERRKHIEKFRLCQKAGILLLQIDEHDWMDSTRCSIWKSIIASKLGRHKRIAARKTHFARIDLNQATDFLNLNHLQGSTPSIRYAYGLFKDGALLAVVTYAMHNKSQLNLTRMAFAQGVTVVGGAQKLFKNSLALLPPSLDIVTFSNNQYSDGSVYGVLGMEKAADLPPSYQWHYKNRVWNKRLFRHSQLAKKLGADYNPAETEHQNMYRVGARCLYDAGYQKWIFKRCS